MKKRFTTAICIVALGLSATACGSSNTSTGGDEVTSVAENIDESITEESSTDVTETETESTKTNSSPATIEETVLLEQDGVVVKATKLDKDSIWGTELGIYVENNSDKNIIVQAEDVSINDYMITQLFSAEVSAGKKTNDTMSFTKLDELGIDTIATIEMQLKFVDPDSYSNLFTSEPIVIKTSAADSYTQLDDDSGTVVYDEDGIKIIARNDLSENSFGTGPVFFMTNNSDNGLIVQIDEFSVNGFMITPLFSATLPSNKKAIKSLDISSTNLEENSIEKIEEIEFIIKIADINTYQTIKTSETITLTYE